MEANGSEQDVIAFYTAQKQNYLDLILRKYFYLTDIMLAMVFTTCCVKTIFIMLLPKEIVYANCN